MSPRLRNVLTRGGSFALAALLLYLALRGVDLSAIGTALRTADYRWLPLLLGLTVLSLALRAWRWQLLLDALPGEGRRASLKLAFYSVNIGYMVNYAAPRLGEVARAANLSAQSRFSLSGVFGTVVVERVLDMASLATVLAAALLLFLDRLAELETLLFAPAQAQIERLPLLWLVLGGAAALLLAALLYVLARRSALWATRVQPLLASFQDGLLTLVRAERRGALVLTTVGIWLCYWLMAYLPLVMLHLASPYSLSLGDALGLMALGALGIAVPSPGGMGSYHYITIQGLVYLFAVPEAPAASYAVLSHGAQLLFYVAAGLLCLALQGSSLRALRRTTRAAEADDAATSA